MYLKVAELADAAGVNEKTVLFWIRDMGLPAHKQDDRYRINRVDLLEWATTTGISIPPEIFAVHNEQKRPTAVSDALQLGGIFYTTCREILRKLHSGKLFHDFSSLPASTLTFCCRPCWRGKRSVQLHSATVLPFRTYAIRLSGRLENQPSVSAFSKIRLTLKRLMENR